MQSSSVIFIKKVIVIGLTDLKTRYNRSVIGPLWISIGTLIGVAGLGTIWATLLKMPYKEFVPNLTVGLVFWQLISSSITESVSVFSRNTSVIKNLPSDLSLFPALQMVRSILTFFHNIIVVIIVYVIFSVHLDEVALLILPILFVNFLILYYISGVLGLIGARFRDFEPIVTAFMPILFFMSPVVYSPSMLGSHGVYMYLNPLTYMIQSIRDPLIGKIPSNNELAILFLMLVISWVINKICFKKFSKKLAIWL